MKAFIKIFRFLPPESAHFIGLFLLKILNSVSLLEIFFPVRKTNFTPREFFGLEFRNTLGVAAGLDKNGDFVDVLDSLGFGFIEMNNNDEAKAAMEALSGKELSGRTLVINEARAKQ